MKRRQFITLIGGAAASPLAAHAQRGFKMLRVGTLLALPRENWIARSTDKDLFVI
jgi:hypothetical protein